VPIKNYRDIEGELMDIARSRSNNLGIEPISVFDRSELEGTMDSSEQAHQRLLAHA
jgi:hypothetical protein